MTVDSPLALFTTIFGWQFYNTVWDVLLGTGIALIPFLGALIDVFFIDREDGESVGDDPKSHFRRLEAQILVMLAVVAIGVQPAALEATSLGPNTLTYLPYPTILEPDPVVATTTDSDSTFAATDLSTFEDSVPVPVWWYGVMSLSQGINRAIIEGFPEVESIRDVLRIAQIAHINDPVLASEASDFYSECFIPARSELILNKTPDIDAEEAAFMGSEIYVNGAYQTLRARFKVRGFPFDENRDADLNPNIVHLSGKPTCEQWWLGIGTDGREGLRAELLAAAEETATGFEAALVSLPDIVVSVATPDIVSGGAQDVVLKRLLNNSEVSFSNDSFRQFSDEDGFEVRSLLGQFINSAGVFATTAFFTLFIDVVSLGLPMIQPMILMASFALLPFLLVASRYSLSALVGGAIFIFTVSFWPVLWYIATFMDDQLVKAMFPGDGGLFEDAEDLDTKKNLLNIISMSLFLILPGVFSAIMSVAGIQAVTATTSVSRSLGAGGAGVNKAAGGAESLGRLGGSKAIGGAQAIGRSIGKK